MFFSKLSTILSALSITAPAADVPEHELVKQVAIIGAGPAGASAAYYLHKFAEEEGFRVNITVFERSDRIGGRTLTVDAYGNSSEPVELGASIFVKENHIMVNATRDFDLSVKEPEIGTGDLLGIWNGESFVYTQDDGSWGWWNLAKLFWKYGMAPYKAQKLVRSTVATFLKLYEAPHFPFKSLTERAFDLGLLDITAVPGTEFLSQNGISEAFSNDIIQAATRVNYASNLGFIHGLETMVSMAPEGAMQVVGGNWRIFSEMLKRSNATVFQDSTVAHIGQRNNTGPAAPPKYLISTEAAKAGHDIPVEAEMSDDERVLHDQYSVAFDNVIVAAPWQYAGITTDDGLLEHSIDEIPYTKLHVTLFASPFLLSPAYFGLPAGSVTPDSVLTTLGPQDKPEEGRAGVGKAGFYSLSTLRTVTNPKTQKQEYLYKVFSAEEVTAKFLSEVLGAEVPETFISTEASADSEEAKVEPVSWIHPHVFHSYPILYPRVSFQDPILADGLYYTPGVESFISTMETSALMGKNVARLIADELAAELAAQKEAEAKKEAEKQKAESLGQKILGGDEIIPDEL
ncbi:prenylcysteine oxidase [Plectosphaerella plurivora]|uniref:Prenylcysteine oxidase n=1 Tax=Plectosphaerella plurivora TaxID=936078 RepID=A0A9P9A8A4_9PEZI|nr:prenylcysteine oxidase [Plectosphaerella plurivora]